MTINLASSRHEDFLPSITSTELRKIIILTRELCDCRVLLQRMEWVSVDKQLCNVVDRLRAMGHRHTLEVELRFVLIKADSSENDFSKALPGFRERGAVTIIDHVYGDLVHRSCTHHL